MSIEDNDGDWRARVENSLSILDQRSISSEAHFYELKFQLEGLQRSVDQLVTGFSSSSKDVAPPAPMQPSMREPSNVLPVKV